MKILSSLIRKERSHLQKLNQSARKLINSIILANLVGPLLSIFISAFIYRQTSDIKLVALYNLGRFIGLPLAFFINGFLIKRVKVSTVYLFATIAQGLVVIPLVYFSWISVYAIFFLGLLLGVADGFYWSNRHFFTLEVTKSNIRNYFSGLEISIESLAGVLIPLVVGWFIVLGEILGLYSAEFAYRLLLLVGFFVLYKAGRIMKEVTSTTDLGKFPSLPLGLFWNKTRVVSLGKGIGEGGLIFIPVLMVLLLVGKEGALGTLNSATALIATIVVYYVGKKSKIRDRTRVLGIGLVLQLIAAILFGVLYSAIGVIIYFIFFAFSWPLLRISIGPMTLDAIDKDSKSKNKEKYNYLFDVELFLNLGRAIGASIFLFLAITATTSTALRVTPIILAILMFLILPVANSLSKETHNL